MGCSDQGTAAVELARETVDPEIAVKERAVQV